MKKFVAGFVVGSAVWLAVLYAQSTGRLDLFGSDEATGPEIVMLPETEVLSTEGKPKRRGKRRKAKRRRTGGNRQAAADPGYDTGEGFMGDDLGSPGTREVAMGGAGREEQLSSAQIDRGIDRVFRGIERCLVLVPSNAPATGKLVLGMHIASSGRVTKVNLKGPNVLIKGEAGACFRRTVKTIRFDGFDGPDMIVHYPIIFD
jgi:hypothetical protein